jgi:hypothetical protein
VQGNIKNGATRKAAKQAPIGPGNSHGPREDQDATEPVCFESLDK